MGVIFQDFVCYDLHLDENIGVGRIDEVEAYLNEANENEPHSGDGPETERCSRRARTEMAPPRKLVERQLEDCTAGSAFDHQGCGELNGRDIAASFAQRVQANVRTQVRRRR